VGPFDEDGRMKITAPALLSLLLLPSIMLACGACASGSAAAPAELQGTWAGDCRVVVDWVERERLELELCVAADGVVTGRVAEARLSDAHVRRNRGAFGRALGWWTDWIVEGELEGTLLADEGFVARRVTIPFDVSEGGLAGGLHAWGDFADGRAGGRLSAGELHLERR
jgi:hypothetical protein